MALALEISVKIELMEQPYKLTKQPIHSRKTPSPNQQKDAQTQSSRGFGSGHTSYVNRISQAKEVNSLTCR